MEHGHSAHRHSACEGHVCPEGGLRSAVFDIDIDIDIDSDCSDPIKQLSRCFGTKPSSVGSPPPSPCWHSLACRKWTPAFVRRTRPYFFILTVPSYSYSYSYSHIDVVAPHIEIISLSAVTAPYRVVSEQIPPRLPHHTHMSPKFPHSDTYGKRNSPNDDGPKIHCNDRRQTTT